METLLVILVLSMPVEADAIPWHSCDDCAELMADECGITGETCYDAWLSGNTCGCTCSAGSRVEMQCMPSKITGETCYDAWSWGSRCTAVGPC